LREFQSGFGETGTNLDVFPVRQEEDTHHGASVVLSEARSTTDPSFGFVVSNRPDNAVLLMNLSDAVPAIIELWQLASAQDLRLTRRIPLQIHANEAAWTSRFLKEAVCLPNSRVLVAINYSTPARTGLFLYNLEQQPHHWRKLHLGE
jgi:hypothetical protein